jgi:putative sterol carrier protein
MKGMKVANDFLNGKMDTFTAIATGDVIIKGQTPMLDSMSLILDRIPMYLS